MTQFAEKPMILSLKVRLKADHHSAFADWQARMNGAIAAAPGFISIEFLAPTPTENHWIIIQRFSDVAQAANWKQSVTYDELLQALKTLTDHSHIEEVLPDTSSMIGGVTEVIVAEVFPEKQQDYLKWSGKIHQLEAKAPGFRGVYVQSPIQTSGRFWITLLQFDTMENLDRWLNSTQRLDLLEESKSLVSYFETHRVISPYAGWFASIAKVGELPSVWKQTMLVLLVLFPIVMLEFKYLSPLMTQLNISLSTFIGNALSVSLISFPMLPIAIYFLKWWLSPNKKYRQLIVFTGTLFVISLYLLEIWTFWNFI